MRKWYAKYMILYQVSISQQDFREIDFGDGNVSLGELIKLQFEHLRLKIVHEFIKAFVV